MNIDLLVKMANEIGAFFAGESSPEKAPRDVATHLKRYWEPRMRKAMLAHYAQGGAGLTDLARAGVGILAAEAGSGAAGAGAAGAGASGAGTGAGAAGGAPGGAGGARPAKA